MNTLRNFFVEDDGLGTIEIAILVAVLVGLAILFRKQIVNVFNDAIDQGTSAVENANRGDDAIAKAMRGEE